MADSVMVYSDTSSATDLSDTDGQPRKSREGVKTVLLNTSAKSARALVKSQEKLIEVLQDLRYELGKLDREASRVKEDIVRSNQVLAIELKHKYESPVTPTENYRKSKSSALYKSRDSDLNLRYLNRISTMAIPSVSLYPASRSYGYDRGALRRWEHDEICSRRSSISAGSSTDGYRSGTESEIGSPRYWSRGSTGSRYSSQRGSTESLYEAAGSSTESLDTLGRAPAPGSSTGRRPSYFHTHIASTPSPTADDVDV